MAPSRLATPPPSTTLSSGKGESVQQYGDFRDDFFRDGYVNLGFFFCRQNVREVAVSSVLSEKSLANH